MKLKRDLTGSLWQKWFKRDLLCHVQYVANKHMRNKYNCDISPDVYSIAHTVESTLIKNFVSVVSQPETFPVGSPEGYMER